MSDRPGRLTVWLDERPVADLDDTRRGLRLRYRPEILEEFGGRPLLSCSLPVQYRPLDATHFIDGLLPEGPFRAVLAAKASLNANDTYGMVARYGRDIAGALVVLDADQDLEARRGSVEQLDEAGLEAEVAALPTQPLGIHDDSELSIAGLQNKLLLVRLDGGGWARPVAGSPSTHILKLDSQSHPGVVAAEAAVMTLARAVGLTTVDIELDNIGGIDCIIVERFDREIAGGQIRRIHQEDACQALGLPPARKYELPGRGTVRGGGGPEFSRVAAILDKHAIDAPHELEQLAKVAAFTAITGNSDAHGKNVALLHRVAGAVTLAPLYDTVPTILFPKLKDEAAMTIGGAVNLETVDSAAIEREAELWRFDPDRSVQAASDLATALLDALETLSIDRDGDVARLVRSRCGRFILSG
ncbi:MAG: type II toxin-antitoxin system HipA family toxin [Hyphomicrobiales bacterium]|nr:type II toxin-antitoxin system HipA family toxin [Hyphomicrobiales bacterium]